jgi:hypothetical protein
MLIIDEKEGGLVPMFDIAILNLDFLMDQRTPEDRMTTAAQVELYVKYYSQR